MATFEHEVEYTDTFNGEANYCWVKRATVKLTEEQECMDTLHRERALVKTAKAAVGLTGVRCNRENMGDTIVLRPRGMCTICFINTSYN